MLPTDQRGERHLTIAYKRIKLKSCQKRKPCMPSIMMSLWKQSTSVIDSKHLGENWNITKLFYYVPSMFSGGNVRREDLNKLEFQRLTS
jgi:hypothetical protein